MPGKGKNGDYRLFKDWGNGGMLDGFLTDKFKLASP